MVLPTFLVGRVAKSVEKQLARPFLHPGEWQVGSELYMLGRLQLETCQFSQSFCFQSPWQTSKGWTEDWGAPGFPGSWRNSPSWEQRSLCLGMGTLWWVSKCHVSKPVLLHEWPQVEGPRTSETHSSGPLLLKLLWDWGLRNLGHFTLQLAQ